jgi:hypothetical protein
MTQGRPLVRFGACGLRPCSGDNKRAVRVPAAASGASETDPRPRVGHHPLTCDRFLNIGAKGLPPRKTFALHSEDSAESTGGRLSWPLAGSQWSPKQRLSHRWALQAYFSQFRRTPRGRQPTDGLAYCIGCLRWQITDRRPIAFSIGTALVPFGRDGPSRSMVIASRSSSDGFHASSPFSSLIRR